jgi:iron(III) transport system substrate-binding protein
VVKTAKVNNPALAELGTFRADELNVGTLSKNTAVAQKIFDRAGWR